MSEKAVWLRIQEEKLDTPYLRKKLSEKFTITPTADGEASRNVKESKVLDALKARCINILCRSALKQFSYDDIKELVLKCDCKYLTKDVIEQLIKYLPKPENLAQLKDYKSSELTDVEQFCVKISEIEGLLPRLESLSFKHTYADMVNDTKPKIATVIQACNEVKESEKFTRILEVILLFGNYMNSGTWNAQAYGFELNVLTKLTEIKDTDNEQTLLHHLVETIENHFPELLNFYDEMRHIDEASLVSLYTIQETLKQMDDDVTNLQDEINYSREPQGPNDKFLEVMGKFVQDAREQCDDLQRMNKEMETLFMDLSEIYVFDKQRYSLEEFFTDLKTFKDSFIEAWKDNERAKKKKERG